MRRLRNQVAAGLVFMAAVLIGVIGLTGASDLARALDRFPLGLFAPILGLKLINWALRYWEWRYFLGVIGVRTVRGGARRPAPDPRAPAIRERDSAALWLAGLAMSVSPGKLGEVLKAVVLRHLTGVAFARAAPVIFLERLVDGLAVIPMTTVALLAAGGSVAQGEVSLDYVRAVLVGVTLALAVGSLLLQVRPLAEWALGVAARLPGLRRGEDALRALYDASYDLIKLRHLAPTWLMGLGAYLTDSLGFFLILTGLGLEASWSLLAHATFILGFSVIIASLSTLPGGAGGREITIGALLSGALGLAQPDAGTATFLIALFQLWVGVLVGLAVIALARRTLFPSEVAADLAARQAARTPAAER